MEDSTEAENGAAVCALAGATSNAAATKSFATIFMSSPVPMDRRRPRRPALIPRGRPPIQPTLRQPAEENGHSSGAWTSPATTGLFST